MTLSQNSSSVLKAVGWTVARGSLGLACFVFAKSHRLVVDSIGMKLLFYYCIVFSIMTPLMVIMSDFPPIMDVLKLVVGVLLFFLPVRVYSAF